MHFRRHQNTAPCFMIARFDSTCPETGKQIRKGDEIAYYPSARKAYHKDSNQAAELRGMQFNQAWGMADANY